MSDVNNPIDKLTVILAFLTCLHPWAAGAEEDNAFPRMPVDAKTLRVQDQAEEVYERTDYKRAFFIYRNELAPIGDKYGQYMVGFMYLTGKGVEEDRVAGSAWYRLAAERGTKEFVGARDGLMATLDPAEKALSDKLFLELRKQYGDLVLMVRALRHERKLLDARTGSRASSSDVMPMTVISTDRSGSRTTTGADYYGRIERRMQARLDFIQSRTRIEISDANVMTLDLDSIEQQVSEHLNELD
ncbi:MAG: hypothetical protein OEM76_09460 [Gammaproteobacteria bacterium]|nr:hypothetical protein [Gammaproteobacteria bacterium]